MKLVRIRVSNFRSLLDINLELHDYTTLIGPNGAGKSSILYALEWFFGDRTISVADRHYSSDDDLIKVTLNFDSLSSEQQKSFGQYSINRTVELCREFRCQTGKSRYLGAIKTVRGFIDALEQPRIGDARTSYHQLRKIHPNLEELTGTFSKDDMQSAFLLFVNDPLNAPLVEVTNDAPADGLFQQDGAFRKHCKLVFISGGQDITGELASTSKTSLLSELTTSLIDPTRQASLHEWTETNQESLSALKTDTYARVQAAVEERAQTINANLTKYDRRVQIHLDPTSPEVEVRYPVSITTKIRIGEGELESIEDQGHGTQRAVLMAMVETLHAQTELEGDEESCLRILAVEEPEVYQHPTRAKSFAKTLKALSDQIGYQVLIATHSPSFVSTDFINSLRIMRNSSGYSTCYAASLEEVRAARKKPIDEVRTWLDRELPRGIADAFFADLVVLVEGETDNSVLPELSELVGVSFDELGIVCLHVDGKQNLPVFKEILDSLGLKNFVIADGDFCDDQVDASDSKKEASRRQTTDLIERIGLTAVNDQPKYKYGDPSTIIGSYCIYKVDLEEELSSWSSYQSAYEEINPNRVVKSAHKYRRATKSSSYEDMPQFLKDLIDEIHSAVL